MSYSTSDHSFVVCAYKESPFLEDCIVSLLKQTEKSTVLIATSTPNDHIAKVCEKYDVKLLVNTGEKGIGGDWNFGFDSVNTPLVTIAHQDDIYEPDYLKEILALLNKQKNSIIAFSSYMELRNNQKTYSNRLLKIKRFLLWPLNLKFLASLKIVKRGVLCFGNPICCPAVTYVKELVGATPFSSDFGSNIDWQQWEKLSFKKGAFAYCNKPLMCHRIHKESTTSAIINDNKRTLEDYAMFLKFWPKFIARPLSKIYSKSEKSNEV